MKTAKQNTDAASYRRPMPVTEQLIYQNLSSHYLCPRCGITMEREFTAYCDRCGQCLNWKRYKKARCTFVNCK